MNKDFSTLILNPLDRMIDWIKQVAMDPMKIQKNKLKIKNQENEANKIE